MTKDKVYNIYYCSDENGLTLMKQSIDSIGKNCSSKYTIHCLISSSKSSLISGIKKEFSNYSNIKIITYNCSNFIEDKFTNYEDIAYLKHISKATMIRIYLNKFMDLSNIDRILYLDNDTYINKDLKELFETNLDDYYIGAVRDTFINWSKNFEYRREKFYLDKIRKNTYFNGGVELLNIKKMLKDNMFEVLQKFNLKPYMRYTDQDIYNIVFEGHVKYLDLKYNCKWWMNFNKDNMVIIHAAGHKNQIKYLKFLSLNLYKHNKIYKKYEYYDALNKKADLKLTEAPKPRVYNIYYCTDSNDYNLMIMSIMSLIKNSNKECKYIVHCLTYDINKTEPLFDLNKLNASENIEIKHYDCTNILNEIGNYNDYNNSNTSIPKVTMLRMYIDKIIDLTNIDKILYLDNDTYINQDLEYIFETDLTDKYIGAVRDITVLWSGAWDDHELYNDYRKNGNYFNGGVELLNIPEMLKDNKFFDLQMASFKNKKYELADQDIYNEVLGSKVKFMDLYFNYKWWMDKWDFNYIYILHFAGCKKKKKIYMNFLLNNFKNLPHKCKWDVNSLKFKYYYDMNFVLED